MMRPRLWLNLMGAVSLLVVLNLSTPVAAAQTDSCADTLAPRLSIGGYGRVTPGNPNNVRDTASTTGKLLGKIPGGDDFKVLDGPKCVDGLNWWQVQTVDFQGWTVEADAKDYWVAPFVPSLNVTKKDGLTHIEFDDVSFDVDSKLADSADYDFSVGDWNSESPLPEYFCIYLKLDPAEEKSFDDIMCFLRTNGMKSYVNAIKQLMAANIISHDPDGRSIPIPFNGAAQMIQAQMNYVTTDSAKGIGFVTYYAQMDNVIRGDQLEYNFSGFSPGGKYIIYFSHSLDTTLISSENPTDDQMGIVMQNPLKYYKSVVTKLNRGSHADFTPNLDDLNTIVKSITFH